MKELVLLLLFAFTSGENECSYLGDTALNLTVVQILETLCDGTGVDTVFQLFYCTDVGCASEVTRVFCNDLPLPVTTIEDCQGPPPPNSVCQHNGRAFVSLNTTGSCEFEGVNYIKTGRCTDLTGVCSFQRAATQSPIPVEARRGGKGLIIFSIIGGTGLLLVLLVLLFYKVRQKRNQNQHPESNSEGELSGLQNGHCASEQVMASPEATQS